MNNHYRPMSMAFGAHKLTATEAIKKKLLSVFLLSLTIAAVFILGACRYIGAEMSKKTISFYAGDKLYTTVRTAGQESISLPNAPDGLGEFEGWYFDEGTWRDPLTKDTYATTDNISGGKYTVYCTDGDIS